MPTKVQDRDAIVSRAIEIAKAEERDAYIARACGDDAELRRRVEELVAARVRDGNIPNKPIVASDGDPASPKQEIVHAGAHQADQREDPRRESSRLWRAAGKYPRVLATAAVLLLFAAAVGSTSLAVWAWSAEKRALAEEQQVVDERDRALKTAADAKHQLDQAEAQRKAEADERDQALEAEKAALRSAEDTRAVLAFLEDKVMSAGRPKGWSGGLGKNVTLRQAVDAAELEVAKAFADRPLAEASIRETLGSTYLDLEEAVVAVKQYERALALREAILGDDQPATVACRNKLALAYRRAGRTADASGLYDKDLNSSSHADALAIQGSALLTQKKPVEAGLKLRECLAIRQKLRPDDWTTFDTMSMLGEALLDQKKYAEAEPLLRAGYEGLKRPESQIPSPEKARLTNALERLVRLYEEWDKKDKAAKWLKELEQAKSTKRP